MPRTLTGQVLRFIASVAAFVLLAAHPAAAAPPKPAPTPPTTQAQLEARVKDLETRLAAAEQKADKATMEKEYILRTQNHYEAYYKEVFSTQTHILWTIGVTVTLIALTFSVVFFVAGRFGFNIFDRRIEAALANATARLQTDFAERLANESNARQQAHAAELKTLEDGLTKRITDLEAEMTKRISQQEKDLKAKSEYQFQFAQGLGFYVNGKWDQAIKHFRMALGIYKKGKPRGIFTQLQGNRIVANIFWALRGQDKEKFEEAAKKELEGDVYNELENELNFAATEVKQLVPLLKERDLAASPLPAVEPKPAEPEPTAPPPGPDPKDDK